MSRKGSTPRELDERRALCPTTYEWELGGDTCRLERSQEPLEKGEKKSPFSDPGGHVEGVPRLEDDLEDGGAELVEGQDVGPFASGERVGPGRSRGRRGLVDAPALGAVALRDEDALRVRVRRRRHASARARRVQIHARRQTERVDRLGSKRVQNVSPFEGSPYLSSLSHPTQVSQAHLVGTEVIISLHGLSKGGGVFLDTYVIATHSS